MIPNISGKIKQRQQSQKLYHDKRSKHRPIQVGDNVFVRNFQTGDVWLPGTIIKASGPLSFQIKLEDGRMVRRHIDHLITRSEPDTNNPDSDWIDMPDIDESTPTETTSTTETPPLRRSTRVSVPPKRYGQENFQT